MLAFIAVLSEVQIVLNVVRLVGSKLDGHIELTPSFLLNAERWLLEHYSDCNCIVSISNQITAYPDRSCAEAVSSNRQKIKRKTDWD